MNAVLAGRRNNPADPKVGLPPLAVYNPVHYQELPELFMDFICSLTGKSPSTTGAGSEGALTKGPFNALPPIIDLNNALVSMLLTGYGAYEHSNDPMFDPARLSLLDRGFVFAVAHVRGGGEMGRRWYEDGKLLRKSNTFSDFIACAEMLIESGWTSPGSLAIRGRSAGGLLIGAVLNERPELFACAVAQVPFVDALTTMLDEKLPLTVNEYDEWGDPRKLDYYRCIKSYSPYDNLHAARYPAILATGAFNDPRVSYWEPAKWVARLRTLNEGEAPVVLETRMDAGHMGPSGRYDSWREEARVMAFVISELGLDG